MADNFDFEIVPNSRSRDIVGRGNNSSGVDQIAGAIAENLDRIVDIAATVVEIQKMQVQADACINMLREQRLMLETETEAYVKRINADTNATVSKAEAISRMMHDYYIHGHDRLSGEDFSRIISDILDHMGTL